MSPESFTTIMCSFWLYSFVIKVKSQCTVYNGIKHESNLVVMQILWLVNGKIYAHVVYWALHTGGSGSVCDPRLHELPSALSWTNRPVPTTIAGSVARCGPLNGRHCGTRMQPFTNANKLAGTQYSADTASTLPHQPQSCEIVSDYQWYVIFWRKKLRLRYWIYPKTNPLCKQLFDWILTK